MGKCLLVFALSCAPAATPNAEIGSTAAVQSKLVAAYATDERPALRARIVCAVVDASPKRWTDVVVHDPTKIASCEMLLHGECDGRGDVVRACSLDPLPGPLVPRGWVVLRHEMPEAVRYEAFASTDECASAKAERKPANEGEAWLDAQITVETRDLDETKASLKAAERKLAEARAAQDPNVPLLQMEVESQRRRRDLGEKLLAALRAQRGAATIACSPAGGS